MARRRDSSGRFVKGSGGTGSFSGDLAAFAAGTQTTLDEAHRGIVIELFSSVISDTPVDTGRAAGNWQTNVGDPKRGTIERLSPDGSLAIAEVVANAGHLGDKVYMSNNLPYAERLEYGWSKAQAPQGMVRKNVARVQQIVASVVSRVRGKSK